VSLKYEEFPKLRVAANLGATVTVVLPAISIKGAVQAAFYLFATNANIPASYILEVRRSGHGWVSTVGASGLGVSAAVPGGAVPLNGAGAVALLGIDPTNATLKSMPVWDEAQLTIVGHATLTITGLAVEAQVMYDRDDGSGDKINNSPTS
jgi:hypothetical protein